MHPDWHARINNTPRPFNLVSQNLRELGALSINKYISSAGSDILPAVYAPEKALPVTKTHELAAAIPFVKQQSPAPDSTVNTPHAARLHQACQRAFGTREALKFDFVEENGHECNVQSPATINASSNFFPAKQCIITITRPNGSVRSYQTEPIFPRKIDAKAEAAKIAIDMGALEFIQMGDLDSMKVKNEPLLPPPDNVDPGNDGLVKEIEDSCIRWRAGEVTPQWFFYRDLKVHGH
jgi:hypothetical protein